MVRRVGVVSLQGDFDKHLRAIAACREPGVEPVPVRSPEDLRGVERVILPGGESTTVGLLMQRYGLGAALKEAIEGGMPAWGTCMGMILMAREVEGRDQYRLGVLDITVRRNAFGAQVHSFEDTIPVAGLDEPVTAVFIRAPVVTRVGEGVEVLARYEGQIVAVRQGARLATSFHPELTDDLRFHRWFLSWNGR